MEESFEKVYLALGIAEAVEREREKGTAKGSDFHDYIFEASIHWHGILTTPSNLLVMMKAR